MQHIFDKIVSLRQQGKAAALVTVTDTKGSTPRKTGSKMIVLQDGTIHGSVGGSRVEAIVVEESRECIKKNTCRKVTHRLDDIEGHDTGMICGGVMEFFIEPLALATPLFIFGGGHIAVPLAKLAATVGFSLTLIEDREEFADKIRFPDAAKILHDDPEIISGEIDFSANDFICIITRSHDQDYKVLRQVIDKPYRYLGVIGSKSKRKQILAQLHKEGIAEENIKKIHTPIGMEIKAQTPEEIAVSIVAEMINIRNKP